MQQKTPQTDSGKTNNQALKPRVATLDNPLLQTKASTGTVEEAEDTFVIPAGWTLDEIVSYLKVPEQALIRLNQNLLIEAEGVKGFPGGALIHVPENELASKKEVADADANRLDTDSLRKEPLPPPPEKKQPKLQFSVGAGGKNIQSDVHIIQQLLNKINMLDNDIYDQEINAIVDQETGAVAEESIPETIKAIERFQREVMYWGDADVDRKISKRESPTLAKLKEADASYVEKRLAGYPKVVAEREELARQKAEQEKKAREKAAEDKRKAEEEELKRKRQAEYEKELSETSDDDKTLKNIYDRHEDLESLAVEMRKYAPFNPKLVAGMLSYVWSLSSDNLAYQIAKDEKNLSRYSKDLLTSMRNAMASGWTTDEEQKEIERIDAVLNTNESINKNDKDLLKDQLNNKSTPEAAPYASQMDNKFNSENLYGNGASDKRVYNINTCNVTSLAMALRALKSEKIIRQTLLSQLASNGFTKKQIELYKNSDLEDL
ncbi:hypothetical protein E1176_04365, partial [Fulvivirga sp. RKSG066]|uniref:hypothetical protein n=1 Tax=Fulvivirga aurantia TaxID=2529383 RepID=UPI001CA3B65D